MSEVTWNIIDGKTYPYVEGLEPAVPFSYTEPYPKWAWRSNNAGVPYLEPLEKAKAFEFSAPYPKWVWRVSPNYAEMPYFAPLYMPAPNEEIIDNGYITVFDMATKQGEFDTNGLRILCPISCKKTEELNGAYDIVLEHPFDTDGAYRHIKELNIIKSRGQLYVIYRVVGTSNGNSGKITAYARHISYVLLDSWIFNANINASSGQDAIAQIMSAVERFTSDSFTEYRFTVASDLQGSYTANLADCTPISALFGADNSVLNAMGGELYRDNFYISINQRKEDAIDNAFDIRMGLNLTGITREVDYSDFCTYLRVYDGFGNWWAVSYVPNGRFARNVVRSITLKYDTPPTAQQLAKDGQAYFDTIKEPRITYKVNIASLKNNPDYAEFTNLFKYKVGDSGTIYDEQLEISTHQRVIKRTVDEITGEVTDIVFGNTERSLTRKPRYSNMIATNTDKFIIKQITQAEAKKFGTHADMAKYTHAELARFTHAQLGGKG